MKGLPMPNYIRYLYHLPAPGLPVKLIKKEPWKKGQGKKPSGCKNGTKWRNSFL